MYMKNNPTCKKSDENLKVEIVRIAPNDQSVVVEYRAYGYETELIKLIIREVETGKIAYEEIRYFKSKPIKAEGLLNGVLYSAEIIICDFNQKELYHSNIRLFETGFFPGVVVDYIHQNDMTFMESGEFISSPYIIKLKNGQYIASHDVFCHDYSGHSTLCRFLASSNYGKDWKYLSSIEHATWASMFLHNDKIYVVGTSGYAKGGASSDAEGDVLLYCSENDGVSWSEPVVIAKHTKTIEYRTSSVPLVEANGRIWIYTGVYDHSKHDLGAAVLSVDLTKDIMDSNSWILSDASMHSEERKGAPGKWSDIYIEEGNLIIDPDGEIKLMMRCNSHRYDPPVSIKEKICSIIFSIDKNDPKKAPVYEKAIPFNGSLSKFFISRDDKEGDYFGLVNRMTTDHIWQRNVLSLVHSKDLTEWHFERDLINLEDIAWFEDDGKSSVSYPSFMFEGENISALTRTAMNNAESSHNTNALVFHCFKKYRDKYSF